MSKSKEERVLWDRMDRCLDCILVLLLVVAVPLDISLKSSPSMSICRSSRASLITDASSPVRYGTVVLFPSSFFSPLSLPSLLVESLVPEPRIASKSSPSSTISSSSLGH